VEKEVFKGRIFRVTVEDISPGLRFERVYQRDGVTVFPIRDGHIRFIRKTTPENPTPRTAPMSAYVNDGESPLNCARRELAEELGLTAEEWTLFTTIASVGGLRKNQHFFVARRLHPVEGVAHRDPNEDIFEIVDLTYDEVRSKTLTGELDAIGSDNLFALLKFVLVA
jgi:ADP-ribose pyrophosphatase